MNLLVNNLHTLGRNSKLLMMLLNDVLLALVCWVIFGPPMATVIASEFSSGILEILYLEWMSFLLPVTFALLYLYFFGFYKSLIKFFDSKDSIFLSLTGAMVFGYSWSIMHVYQFQLVSTTFLSVAILQGTLLAAVFYAFLNISRDVAKYILYPYNTNKDATPVIIYGAGATGNELFQSLLLDPSKKLIAFFDDSKNLRDRQINNIPIIGSFKKLKILKKQNPSLEILLAVPNLGTDERREIISKLERIKVAVRTVPSFHELISDQKKMTDIQNLSLDDLLPRARVAEDVIKNASNKTLFISGAGGSIGSEIARQLLKHSPVKIILFDLSEINLFHIERQCQAIKAAQNLSTEIIPILGDIRDKKNLGYLFNKFQINHVYHAAAYKHVPLVEAPYNITKACENNIIGTHNLALVAIEYGVESFVMISTDKAVRPSNIMGASKRMAEMLIQSLNSTSKKTKFSMVRFGNVINSSGSVIPLFLDQIAKGGPITVTDKEVTRYFMTIPEASNLVLQASQMSEGGEVFILDMGEQLKIFDLAKKLIHLSGRNIASEPGGAGIEIIEVGLRPGEKMYEELLISGEQESTSNPKIFKTMEGFPPLNEMELLVEEIKSAINIDSTDGLINIFKENVEGYNNAKL
ncbi:polysaccharide biosynthesis protein [Gammaproteobacteria bacterium]|nr:polysaccharide biosynthesis protein [Gammaproteobacteria bacterium]